MTYSVAYNNSALLIWLRVRYWYNSVCVIDITNLTLFCVLDIRPRYDCGDSSCPNVLGVTSCIISGWRKRRKQFQVVQLVFKIQSPMIDRQTVINGMHYIVIFSWGKLRDHKQINISLTSRNILFFLFFETTKRIHTYTHTHIHTPCSSQFIEQVNSCLRVVDTSLLPVFVNQLVRYHGCRQLHVDVRITAAASGIAREHFFCWKTTLTNIQLYSSHHNSALVTT